MSEPIQKGSIASTLLHCQDSAGDAVNADATPTVSHVYVNAAAAATTGFTMAQAQDQTPANVVGSYFLSFPTASYAKGDQVDVTVEAVIAGVTVRKSYHFGIVDDPAQRPRLI